MKKLIALGAVVASLLGGSLAASAADPAWVKVAELDGRQTVAVADYCGPSTDGFVRVVRVANSGVETWVYCSTETVS